MLSILIPVYNYDLAPLVKALSVQIESLEQEVELLIRDDGSTILEHGNSELNNLSWVRYFKNDKNLGRSATRQTLAQDASYQQLLFLDADVLPAKEDFLNQYISHEALKTSIGCGGVSYQDQPPAKEQMLRYVFGQRRERQPASVRQKSPYMVLAANLWIKKELFLSLNDQLENFYGDDLVLSQKIRTQALEVVHLDNSVIHLGLESSEVFLNKTDQMIANLVRLEKAGILDTDLMRLQRAYLDLKSKGLCKPFLWATKQLLPGMRRNLLGAKPSMKTFDAYKLHHYTKLKTHG